MNFLTKPSATPLAWKQHRHRTTSDGGNFASTL